MEEPRPSLPDPVRELAKNRFNIDYLFPLQRMAIANVLDSLEDDRPVRQLVLFPTGFGKSLCFQLPALLLPGVTVVVYPLLALMNDQRRSLEARGIPSAMFRGGMSAGEWREQEESIRSSESRIVITNPETFITTKMLEVLGKNRIAHVAVDEAHCVSEWGETFRPAYLKLGEAVRALQPKVVSALTATASPLVASAVADHIFAKDAFLNVCADIDKPNIHYSIESTLVPVHTLIRLVRKMPKPLIVFEQSRAGVRQLCEIISEHTGLETKFYHAGLERGEKTAVEQWFMASADGVLVATCAYGMGVDKKDIRTVIHFREPSSVEAYLQESGRGGRDGKPAEAILIHWERGSPVSRAGDKPAADSGTLRQGLDAAREARQKAFMEFAAERLCRREGLHRLMGSSLDVPCSGCDVCEGTAPSQPEGLRAVLEFFDANPGRFSLRQARDILGRELPSRGESFPTCAGAGLLKDWQDRDIRQLLRECLRRGDILENQAKFRRGKIRRAKLEV